MAVLRPRFDLERHLSVRHVIGATKDERLMAERAGRNPASLCNFMRRNSRSPLSGGYAASMLLRSGQQQAHSIFFQRRPGASPAFVPSPSPSTVEGPTQGRGYRLTRRR